MLPVLSEQSRSDLEGNAAALEKVVLWVGPCFSLITLCSHQFLETPPLSTPVYICLLFVNSFDTFYLFIPQSILTLYVLYLPFQQLIRKE